MRAFLQRAGFGAALLVIVLISAVSAAQAAMPIAQAKQIPSPWTWTDYGPALRDVSCSSPGTCTAVGQRGVTLRDNQGHVNPLAWTRGFLTPPRELDGVVCTHAFCLAVSNTSTTAATFVSRVYRSTDAGQTWSSSVALPAAGAIKTRSAVALSCGPTAGCYAVGPAGGVWLSSDQGRSWQALALPVTPGSYSRVACPAAATCVAVGGDSAGSSAVIVGRNVTSVPLPATTGAGLKGLACDKPTRCTATDGLAHFMSLSIPQKQWGPAKLFPDSISVSALACPVQNVCVGLSDSGLALRTTALSSASGDWHRRPLGTVNLKAISCVQTDCVAVGQAGAWFASFDAGSQFRRVNEVGKFDAIQCSHAFRPTCVAGGMQDIGVSGSGGKLWSLPLSGNLGLDINSVNCTGPSECLFLGKTLTMYTTNLTSFGQRYAATTDPAGAKSTCITKDVCVGIAQGAVYTTLDGAVTPWTHNAFPGAATSMACLSGRMNPAVCLATTVEGFIVLGTMTQSAGDISWNWTTTDADASQALTAIGCSPGGQCTAVGVQGVVLASAGTNLMHWTERILPSIQTPVDQRPALASVTCPADGVCLAGGVNGDDAIIASTTNNWTDFSYDKIQGIEGAAATIKSFGCETVDRCVAVGSTSLIGVRKVLGGSSCVTCSGRLCPKSRLRTRANPQRRCPLYAS